MEQPKANNNVNNNTSTGSKIWSIVRGTGAWTFKLRSILLAIPVTVIAIILAVQNVGRLPAEVGIGMQATGEYSMVISRGLGQTILPIRICNRPEIVVITLEKVK